LLLDCVDALGTALRPVTIGGVTTGGTGLTTAVLDEAVLEVDGEAADDSSNVKRSRPADESAAERMSSPPDSAMASIADGRGLGDKPYLFRCFTFG